MKNKKKNIVLCFIVLFVMLGFVKIEAKSNPIFLIKTYKYFNVTGKRLEVNGLKNQKKQDEINKILLEDSKAVLEPFDVVDESVTITTDITYHYEKDKNQLEVIYKGIYINKTAAHPTAFYAISIVDLDKAKRINAVQHMDLDKLTNAIVVGDFKVIEDNKELRDTQKEYLMNLPKEDYKELFKNINFYKIGNKVVKPEVFLVENNDSIKVILPTIHALGDYVIIEVAKKDLK